MSVLDPVFVCFGQKILEMTASPISSSKCPAPSHEHSPNPLLWAALVTASISVRMLVGTITASDSGPVVRKGAMAAEDVVEFEVAVVCVVVAMGIC